MSNLTTHGGPLPPAPAKMQALRQAGQSFNKAFQDGVRESFPVVSFKGSRWAFRFQGQTSHYLDPQGHPVPYLDVVLVLASPALSRVYYARGYSEGDASPPDCWSVDGVVPDAGVPNRQSPACLGCPQNSFGSKVTPAGKKIKACATSRRVAVALPHDILTGAIGPMMLRVPYSSLANLKEYANFLDNNAYETVACITRITFDMAESFPKLKFSFHRPLTDAEFDAAFALTTDERTTRILSAPIEGGSDEPIDTQGQQQVAQAAAPTPQYQAPPPMTAPPPQAQAPQYPLGPNGPAMAPQPARNEATQRFAPPPVSYPGSQPNASQQPPNAPPPNVHQFPAPVQQYPSPSQFAPMAQQSVKSEPVTIDAEVNSGLPSGLTLPPGAPAPVPSPKGRGRKPAAAGSSSPAAAEPPKSEPAPPGLDSILAAMMPKH